MKDVWSREDWRNQMMLLCEKLMILPGYKSGWVILRWDNGNSFGCTAALPHPIPSYAPLLDIAPLSRGNLLVSYAHLHIHFSIAFHINSPVSIHFHPNTLFLLVLFRLPSLILNYSLSFVSIFIFHSSFSTYWIIHASILQILCLYRFTEIFLNSTFFIGNRKLLIKRRKTEWLRYCLSQDKMTKR